MPDSKPNQQPESSETQDIHGPAGYLSRIPHPAVRRLSLYLRQLEAFAAEGRHTVSSRDLGRALGLGDAQVRKDLANFGNFGQSGVGYRVGDLVARLRRILGTDRAWDVVLMGAGNIGRALLAFRPFAEKGFRLVAVFDSDPRLQGQQFGGVIVQPPGEAGPTVRRLGAQIAVIAVPAEAAQRACDALVGAGVRAILNFAPVNLNVPEGVAVNSVDLVVLLEQLAFQVNAME
jgi:redox-sensing transcriptional repressor